LGFLIYALSQKLRSSLHISENLKESMEKNINKGRAKIWNLSLRVKPRRTERDAKLRRRYLKDKTEGTFSKPTTERCKAMFEIKRMTQGPGLFLKKRENPRAPPLKISG